MELIPETLKRYFWDVDLEDLSKNKFSYFVIERLLEFGDRKAVKWMKDNFSLEEIERVVCTSRNLSRKSANFWRIVFDLDEDKILCLKRSFRNEQKAIWKY